MRKNLAIYQASPRRLLKVLLIASLIASTVSSVIDRRSESYLDSTDLVGRRITTPLSKEYIKNHCDTHLPNEGIFQLRNECSKRWLRFDPRDGGKSSKKVAAMAHKAEHTSYVTLKAFDCKPAYPGGPVHRLVRIESPVTHKSLCFNANGLPIQKEIGSANCFFREINLGSAGHLETYQYQSVLYPHFYVGFNECGRRMKGQSFNGDSQSQSSREKCSYFHRTSVDTIPPKLEVQDVIYVRLHDGRSHPEKVSTNMCRHKRRRQRKSKTDRRARRIAKRKERREKKRIDAKLNAKQKAERERLSREKQNGRRVHKVRHRNSKRARERGGRRYQIRNANFEQWPYNSRNR